MSGKLRAVLLASSMVAAVATASPLRAQARGDLVSLRAEIDALRAEQARTNTRIAELEQAVDAALTGAAPPRPAARESQSPGAAVAAQTAPAIASAEPVAPVNPAGASAPGRPPSPTSSRLALNGDLRVRHEANFGDAFGRDRDRGVLRGRLRAVYAPTKWLSVGGQLVTGDPDDPNSSDITLANYDDDLSVSLDQAYVRFTTGNLQVFAGKIPQPFVRSELVWDGDISPEGLGGSYRLNTGRITARLNGLYFYVDEQVAGPNSDMVGAQIALEAAVSPMVRLDAALGYYDYQLRSTIGGDTGDFRQNRFANGRYLSDFNLLDIIGAMTWTGLGEAWPVRVLGDYVRNLGATTSEDTGFGIDLLFGQVSRRGDFRFSYGYAQAGVDAVLDIFSHDNTQYGSNYYQHSLAVDFVPAPGVILNTTLYHYRPKLPALAGRATGDWLERLRLNLLVTF